MTKELQTKDTSIALPDYLKEFKGEGAEDISADLIERSFLQMAHEDKDNAKLGDFYSSITGDSYGKEVVITVCKIEQNWRKFNEDFQLVAQSSDGHNWDNGETLNDVEKWKCAFIDMFVLLNEHPSPMPHIFSFKSTSYRTGKKLSTVLAELTRGSEEALFARNYTLYTEEAKKGAKPYSVARYRRNSGFNSEEIVIAARGMRKMVLNITPQMNEMTDNEPEESKDFDLGNSID